MLHIKEIKPMFTSILVTGNRYEEDVKVNGVIQPGMAKGSLKLYQTVLATGSMVRDIKVGETIMFNPQAYAKTKYDSNSVKEDMGMNKVTGYVLPWITIYDKEDNPHECLLLKDRDIEFVFNGEEVDENPVKSDLILPRDKSIITN